MADPTSLIPQRVPVIDPRTGLMDRSWYRFFQSLFELAGSGQNNVSLSDLQGGPPPVTIEQVAALLGRIDTLTAQNVILTRQIEELQSLPPR